LIESRDEEEKLMVQYQYPFVDEHIREHTRFVENFMGLKEEVEKEDCDTAYLTFRAQLLLFDWFSGHIAQSDRHAGRHIVRASPTDDMGDTTLRLREFLVADAQRPQLIQPSLTNPYQSH
jgi:hemerythrin